MRSQIYRVFIPLLGMTLFRYAYATEDRRESNIMTVTGRHFAQSMTPILTPIKTVTRDDIDRGQVKSLSEILRLLPGVNVAQMGGMGQQSSVFIRGTNSNHVLILVDGIRVSPSGMSGSVDLSQFPVSLVQKIEYIRGPGLAAYGSDAVGGVINIITHRQKPGSMLMASAGSSSYQRYDISTQQKTGDRTWLTLGANYTDTKGDDVVANASSNSQPDRDGFMSQLLWASLEHQFNGQFSGFAHFYSVDNLSDYDGFSYQPPALLDTRQFYGRTYNIALHFKEGIYTSQLLAGYNHNKDYHYDPLYGPHHSSATLDNTQQHSLQWGNSWRIGTGIVSAGSDWRQQSAYLRSSNSQVFLRNIGIYLTSHQQIKDIMLEGALRHDSNSHFTGHSTWQASVAWELTTNYRLVTSYGTAFKAPHLMQLYSAGGGNITLKPEESRQWESRIERLAESFKWNLSIYRNDIDQLIDYNHNHYENMGSVEINGIEWSGEFNTGPLAHQMSLNYLHPRHSETGEILLRRAKQQVNYQFDWQFRELDWSVTWHYIGQRYDKTAGGIVKLGGASVWDIAVSYPIMANFTVRIKIANLLDKNYETVYGYPLPGREYYCAGSYVF